MKHKKQNKTTETDSRFLLKLVVYVLAGTFWLKFSTPIDLFGVVLSGIPIGLFIGLLFASHDHFQIDRKIEYLTLILMTIITYFLPAGILL